MDGGEIIDAQASVARQSVLTAAEASELEDAIDYVVDILNTAMGR